MKILTARYVLPIKTELIRDGAVAVEGRTIEAVDTLDALAKRYPEAPVEDFGDAAVLPGLVNCHSHLEITAMRGSLDRVESDFYRWLITLTKLRGEVLAPEDIEIAAIAGAVEGASAGVTCFGDIGRMGSAGLGALKAVGLRGVLFQETNFSADDKTAGDDFELLREKFEALREQESDLVEVGLSPHAPYTVSRRLLEKIADFARSGSIKLTVHAAESAEEDELMRKGTGFFSTVYEKFGVEWKSPGCSSVEFLQQTGVLGARPLLAHCVTVGAGDIELIAASGSSVAHCPKSNAKFGHGYAPFEKFRQAEVAIGLGSDSVASNNMCDMIDEARFAALSARNRLDSEHFTSAGDVLFAATLGGARALGLENKIGSLEAAKQADITVISLSRLAQKPVTDVHAALVFSSDTRDVRMTMVAGNEIYRDGTATLIDEAEISSRLDEIGAKLSSFRS